MLDAPPSAAGHERWREAPDAELVDALPYIDDDYGNPRVKAEVDRLVEEVVFYVYGLNHQISLLTNQLNPLALFIVLY